jgi:hypothetical protein
MYTCIKASHSKIFCLHVSVKNTFKLKIAKHPLAFPLHLLCRMRWAHKAPCTAWGTHGSALSKGRVCRGSMRLCLCLGFPLSFPLASLFTSSFTILTHWDVDVTFLFPVPPSLPCSTSLHSPAPLASLTLWLKPPFSLLQSSSSSSPTLRASPSAHDSWFACSPFPAVIYLTTFCDFYWLNVLSVFFFSLSSSALPWLSPQL